MEQMKRTFKHLQYRDRIKIEMMLREKASISRLQTGCTSPIRPSGASCAATGFGMSIR